MSESPRTDAEMLLQDGIHLPSQLIQLTGPCDEPMYDTLCMGLTLIEERHGAKTDITIDLNCPGGSWYDGIAMYDRIKTSNNPITIRVFGMAMSMGSIILQAADTRLIGANATIMVHDGSDQIPECSPEDIQRWAQQSAKICKSMYNIYAENSKHTAKWWSERCKNDCIFDSTEAVRHGLVDGLVDGAMK